MRERKGGGGVRERKERKRWSEREREERSEEVEHIWCVVVLH